MIKVLLLSANPVDSPLSIDEEFRAIDQKIRSSEHREHVELIQHGAVRLDDVAGLLMRHKPHVVHFSGHGATDGISLTGADGKSRPVPPSALADTFRTLKDNVRVVLLNACDSAQQAEGIVSVIDCAVGMSDAIADTAAIAFAAAFYEALGYGRSVQDAFDLALVQLEGVGADRSLANLYKRRTVKPSSIVLVNNPLHPTLAVMSAPPISRRRCWTLFVAVAFALVIAAWGVSRAWFADSAPQVRFATFYIRPQEVSAQQSGGWKKYRRSVDDGQMPAIPISPLVPGDRIRMEGEFDKPGNAYILWFDTAGMLEVYGASDSSNRFDFPVGPRTEARFSTIEATDPAGTQLLVLITSPDESLDMAAERLVAALAGPDARPLKQKHKNDAFVKLQSPIGSPPPAESQLLLADHQDNSRYTRWRGGDKVVEEETEESYLAKVESLLPRGFRPQAALFIRWVGGKSNPNLSH